MTPISGIPATHAAGWPRRVQESTRARSPARAHSPAAATAADRRIAAAAPIAACAPAKAARLGANALAREPTATRPRPSRSSSRTPRWRPSRPSASAVAPPVSAASVRTWPAVAVETPKSPPRSGRMAVSTRRLAWEANIVAKSTGAGRRKVMPRPYVRRRRPPSAPPPNFRCARWRDSRTGSAQLREARRRRGAGGLPRDPQLGVHVREVALDRAHAQVEPPRDLLVREPGCHELEHLSLTGTQVGERLGRGPLGLRGAEEVVQLVDEEAPGRLVLEQDVVAALERDEAGAGDERRQQPSLRERHGLIVAGVEHQGRDTHLLGHA